MSAFKLIKSTPIWTSKHLALVEEDVLLPNGNRVQRPSVEHPGAVVILPRLSSGELVLIKQFRRALRHDLLEFPAGTLEPNEDPFECAKREIIEEVGMQAESWRPLGRLFPAPGFCNEIQYCYLASDLSPATAELDVDEIIEVIKMSPSEVEESIRSGDLVDAKSIAIFSKARLGGLV